MFLRSNRTRNELETFFHPRRPSLLYVRVLSFLNLNNFYSNINYLCVWQYGRVKATPVKNVVSMRLILVKTIKKLGISILNTFFKSHFCFPCFPDNINILKKPLTLRRYNETFYLHIYMELQKVLLDLVVRIINIVPRS